MNYRLVVGLLLLAACREGVPGAQTSNAAQADSGVTIALVSDPARPPIDAAPPPLPATLAERLVLLRQDRLAAAADVIAARVGQRSPKMKLTTDEGVAVAGYLLTRISEMSRVRRLHAIMPHTTVELVRAVAERDVAPDEADRIASYLTRLVDHLAFSRLERFDINHSHVVGREWHEIDYSGEKMTWPAQAKYWSKQGVINFKKAEYIHRYFAHARKLPHFTRVYRPSREWGGFEGP